MTQQGKFNAYSRELCYVYFVSFLMFLRLSITIIGLTEKINDINSGDINKTTSASSFVSFTIICLATVTELVFTKYVGALSDYMGRKPLLVLSSILFAIAYVILAASTHNATFYLATVLSKIVTVQGILSAWVCDLVQDGSRGKALGILLGASIGGSFMIGLPLGIGLCTYSYNLALIVSSLVSILAGIIATIIPVKDTNSSLIKLNDRGSVSIAASISRNPLHDSNIDANSEEKINTTEKVDEKEGKNFDSSSNTWFYRTFVEDRAFPPSWTRFLLEHHCLSGLSLINQAKNRLSFFCYYWSFCGQQLINSIFINYANIVFGWGVAVSGVAVAILAISIAFFSPWMCGMYYEISLFGFGSIVAAIGNFLLGIAGTHLEIEARLGLGLFGLILLGFTGFYFPSIQTIITTQYPPDKQGEVLSVMGVLGQLTIFISYPTTLTFSYAISKDAIAYWPGKFHFKCVLLSFYMSCYPFLLLLLFHVQNGFYTKCIFFSGVYSMCF